MAKSHCLLKTMCGLMFSRKKPLLTKKEASNLWGFWWASATNYDGTVFLASFEIIDEFYDSIVWLETLEV